MIITYFIWTIKSTDKIDFTSSFICLLMSSLRLLNCWWINASWLCLFHISRHWIKEHLDHMTKYSPTPFQVLLLWDWEYLTMFSNKLKTNFMYKNSVFLFIHFGIGLSFIMYCKIFYSAYFCHLLTVDDLITQASYRNAFYEGWKKP